MDIGLRVLRRLPFKWIPVPEDKDLATILPYLQRLICGIQEAREATRSILMDTR